MFCLCCRPASGFFADAATSRPSDLDAAMARRSAYQRRISFSEARVTHPEPTEFIIRNACVLTMDPHIGDLPNGDIHVRDGLIVNLGHRLKTSALHEIDGHGAVALPGTIATHRHLLGDAVGCDGASIDFAAVEAADIYRVLRLALLDALAAGITCLHHCGQDLDPVFAETAILAQLDVGLHGRFSYPVQRNWSGPRIPEDAVELAQRWCPAPDDALFDVGLACDPDEASALSELAPQWPVTHDHSAAAPNDLAGRSRDAARALDLEADVGSLAPGKRADLILIATGVAPTPQRAMARAHDATPAAVRLVAIDGRLRKRNGVLVEPNEGLIRREGHEARARLRAATRQTDAYAPTGVVSS